MSDTITFGLTLQDILWERNYRGGTYVFVGSDKYDQPLFKVAEFSSGYYVARAGGVENLPFMSNPNFMAVVISNIWKAFQERPDVQDYDMLGIWVDDAGNYSIDRTVCIRSEVSAQTMGRFNNQRAIWDIANNTEIAVN